MKHTFAVLPFVILAIFQNAFGQIKKDWQYRDELISYMESPKDTIFIQDRKTLEKVEGLKCNDSTVLFSYKSIKGDSLYIKVESKKFINSEHTVYLFDTAFFYVNNEKRVSELIAKNLIDGKPAYGNVWDYPNMEIKSIKIRWGKVWLTIPDSAYHNLYETHLCLDYLPVEAYITNNNKFLYLYMYASDGAGSYAVKLVFDRTKYFTRIVNTNECSDGYNFLDATEGCE